MNKCLSGPFQEFVNFQNVPWSQHSDQFSRFYYSGHISLSRKLAKLFLQLDQLIQSSLSIDDSKQYVVDPNWGFRYFLHVPSFLNINKDQQSKVNWIHKRELCFKYVTVKRTNNPFSFASLPAERQEAGTEG